MLSDNELAMIEQLAYIKEASKAKTAIENMRAKFEETDTTVAHYFGIKGVKNE